MSEQRYVYKEIEGKDLEQYTTEGWELYVDRAPSAPKSMFSYPMYLVRRPFDKPNEMQLLERNRELEVALVTAKRELSSYESLVKEATRRLYEYSGGTKDDLKTIIENAKRILERSDR